MLQSLIANPADPGTEFKLKGRAIIVVDESQRDAAARHVEASSGWRPRPSWLFVAIGIERVAVLDWQKDKMTLTRWDRASGLHRPERRRLDLDAGAYVNA